MKTRYTDCIHSSGMILWSGSLHDRDDDEITPLEEYPRAASAYTAYDPVTRRFVRIERRYNPTSLTRALIVRLDLECVA